MLMIVGSVLDAVGEKILVVIFDSAPAHDYICRCLHGDLRGLNEEFLQTVPGFREFVWVAPPDNVLPNYKYKQAVFRGHVSLPGLRQCGVLVDGQV